MSTVRRSLMNVNKEEDVDFPSTYFTTYAREAGKFTFTLPSNLSATASTRIQYIQYSIDGGVTWVNTNNINNQQVVIETPVVPQGTFVYWRGKGTSFGNSHENLVNSTGLFDVGGDIFSLLYDDSYEDITSHVMVQNYTFQAFFKNNTNLAHAKHLSIEMYGSLFSYGVNDMFQGCTSLEDTPKITWSSVSSTSYAGISNLFNGCTSLKEVSHAFPRLDFSNGGSAKSVFYGCTSLKKVPDIYIDGASGNQCFQAFFRNCSSLQHNPIKSMPSTLPSNTGIFQDMFRGCSSLEDAPAVFPAMTLSGNTYINMFQDCTNLKVAPVLPATDNLAEACYRYMFQGCSSIKYVKMLALTFGGSYCIQNWLSGAPNTSDCIFVKHIDATWTTTGASGVPSNWTVIYYDPALDKYYTDQTRATECDDHGNPI